MRIMSWVCCFLGVFTLHVGFGGLEAVADPPNPKPGYFCAPRLCPGCQTKVRGEICLFRPDVYWGCVVRTEEICTENPGNMTFVCFGDSFTGTCETPMNPDGPCNEFKLTCGVEA